MRQQKGWGKEIDRGSWEQHRKWQVGHPLQALSLFALHMQERKVVVVVEEEVVECTSSYVFAVALRTEK